MRLPTARTGAAVLSDFPAMLVPGPIMVKRIEQTQDAASRFFPIFRFACILVFPQ
jgi:hypothetical protein